MPIRITNLRCEHYHSPLGISHPSPRLSWSFDGDARDWTQRSYRIEIHREADVDSFNVDSDESQLVPWPSRPLLSRERVTVKVQVEGHDGNKSDTAEFTIEAALLDRSDWSAELVGGEVQAVDQPRRPFRLRKQINTSADVKQARLYITSHGIHEAYINGERVGQDLLAPGWTDYRYTLRYSTHDVTDLICSGSNTLGVWLGEGWYAGRLGFRDGVRNVYGESLGVLAQLEINGEIVAQTGSDWTWSYGNLITSELLDGEVLDSNIISDWDSPDWQPVSVLPFPTAPLITCEPPPVREIERIPAKSVYTTPTGKTIVDFGQNAAGYIQILGEPPSTGELILKYAEVMEHGELGTRPLRAAKATDRIILGGPVKGYKNKFTNHGFRYMQVDGWPGITVDDVVYIIISSQMERTGHFECSHALLNQLHSNVVYSTISNTISLPTDCPQRDERLGWTGDLAVFAPTLNFLFNSAGFLRGWLKDLYDDQVALDGVVPVIVPTLPLEVLLSFKQGIWGDVSALTPWDLFNAFGDKQVLIDQFPSMCLWLDKGVERDPDTRLWTRAKPQLGDWLDPAAPPTLPGRGPTNAFLVADAYLVHTTRLVARVAKVIGEIQLSEKYMADFNTLLKSFHDNYVTPRSSIMSDTQTAISLMLHFDLCTGPEQRQILANRLGQQVTREFWQVSTGFAGTPIILHALASNGMLHHAYRMLLARDSPSWLAPVLLGATTIWERWDSMLQDGSINP